MVKSEKIMPFPRQKHRKSRISFKEQSAVTIRLRSANGFLCEI